MRAVFCDGLSLIFTIRPIATDFVAISFAYVEQNVFIGTQTTVLLGVAAALNPIIPKKPAVSILVAKNFIENCFI